MHDREKQKCVVYNQQHLPPRTDSRIATDMLILKYNMKANVMISIGTILESTGTLKYSFSKAGSLSGQLPTDWGKYKRAKPAVKF